MLSLVTIALLRMPFRALSKREPVISGEGMLCSKTLQMLTLQMVSTLGVT
jgi:hypothetical protein